MPGIEQVLKKYLLNKWTCDMTYMLSVLTESQKDNRCQFPLHLKSDVSLPCKLCQEIVVQYYSSLISSSRLGDGWGDLMTQKRYCFEDTWYVLTSPTGEQKRCFPLPQATWEEGFREILWELDTCHLKSGGIQGPGVWIFPEKTKVRTERRPNQLHVHQLWIHMSFSQGKVYLC